MSTVYDYAVIGAGFYGCRTALQLAARGHHVALIDRMSKVCQRASYINQARVHNGYHYPRSLMTAYASHKNYHRFLSEFNECAVPPFTHLYAIARRNSHVTASYFKRFCVQLGLPLEPASPEEKRLFASDWIEDVFVVEEKVVDTACLGRYLERKVHFESRISLMLETEVDKVSLEPDGALLHVGGRGVRATNVLFTLYAGANRLLEASGLELLDLKAEISEVCLVDVPEPFQGLGVTVMDGMFFSCIPWGSHGWHSFTHVRYTPHASWNLREHANQSPYDVLNCFERQTRFGYMMRDARRLVPMFDSLGFRESLFEIKVVPNRHEIDDGRPIIYRVHREQPLCASVLGSKLDCIYDLEEVLFKGP